MTPKAALAAIAVGCGEMRGFFHQGKLTLKMAVRFFEATTVLAEKGLASTEPEPAAQLEKAVAAMESFEVVEGGDDKTGG